MKKIICFLFIACCTLAVFAQPRYEFRAAWIATVDNIDWPTKGNYNSESQKQEYIRMLDMHKRNGLNAVVVQVRPAADAFYPSEYEPWSEWLTGKQGKPPFPYYDPLEFMIEEAHKRGLEFHAWCNPYRAEFSIGRSSIAASNMIKTHPEWFLTYGTTRYFDPGNKEVQEFVVKVIRDIVSRYNVDAIHFDDYFYPYPIAGKEFPDKTSYKKYGGNMSRDEWRRSNVDSIILKLSQAIKDENRFCRFGISPFGVWRNRADDPEGSNTQAGLTNYDHLYADILLWLRNGWIDYVVPQLYWETGHPTVAYETLLDWWSKHSYGKHCYIGVGMYKAGVNAIWRDKTLLPRQVQLMRDHPDVQGAVYFSSKSFEKNINGWSDSLAFNYYKEPALIPPMPWIDSIRPMQPGVTNAVPVDSTVLITVYKSAVEKRKLKCYRLYVCYDENRNMNNFYNASLVGTLYETDSCVFRALLPAGKKFARFYVTSMDEDNTESLPYANWPLKLEAVRVEKNKWIMN
jgi:uncharacterized lipoprotein YddW (UPF0748 family)